MIRKKEEVSENIITVKVVTSSEDPDPCNWEHIQNLCDLNQAMSWEQEGGNCSVHPWRPTGCWLASATSVAFDQ